MATYGNTWAILSHYCHWAQLPINAAQGAIWVGLLWNKSAPSQTSPNTWVVAGCRHTKQHSLQCKRGAILSSPAGRQCERWWGNSIPSPLKLPLAHLKSTEALPDSTQLPSLWVKRLDPRDSKTAQNNCLLVPLHAMHTCGCKNSLLCKPSFKFDLANAGRLRKRCWINSAQAKRSIKCINQVFPFPIFALAFTARTS